jgi:hypothetical protein
MGTRPIVIALLGACLLRAGAAEAAGAIVGHAGENAHLTTLRIAVASAGDRTAWWAQVTVSGAPSGFAWLVPIRPGGRADLASDAWLDALDAATSPVILPPVTPGACDAGTTPQQLPPTTSPASMAPSRSTVLTDDASLQSFTASGAYTIAPSLLGAVHALFAAGGAVLASEYPSTALPARTVRVVETSSAALPLALTGDGAAGAPVTAFVIASAGATAGALPLSLAASNVLWQGDGTSNYVAARDATIDPSQGTRWLTASASPDLLFDGAPIASTWSLPPVLAEYFALASTYGETQADPASCAVVAAGTSSGTIPFATECPEGGLGTVAGPSPCDGEDAGGASVTPLRCGAADDAVVALAALSAADVWITRIEGMVPASTNDVPLAISSTTAASPVVTSGGYDVSCPSAPAPVPPRSSPQPPGAPPPGPSNAPAVTSGASAAPAAEGCAEVMGDACSSSDSGSDDGSSGCDSSSQTDDSSSDGCGSSDSSSSSGCSTAGRRSARPAGPRRSPVSRAALLLSAIAALARRRGRHRATLRSTSQSSDALCLHEPGPHRATSSGT